MSKMCELCQTNVISESIYDVDVCSECYNGFMLALQDDIDMMKKFSNPENFPLATPKAKEELLSVINSTYSGKSKSEINEIKHQQYAKSFKEFYEYDVVTILNENHGQINKEKMKQILSSYSKNGWKLHTMYSNELGKNAVAFLGLGVNATACEDVLIFERRIENV